MKNSNILMQNPQIDRILQLSVGQLPGLWCRPLKITHDENMSLCHFLTCTCGEITENIIASAQWSISIGEKRTRILAHWVVCANKLLLIWHCFIRLLWVMQQFDPICDEILMCHFGVYYSLSSSVWVAAPVFQDDKHWFNHFVLNRELLPRQQTVRAYFLS